MGKGMRNKKARREGTDRRNVLQTREEVLMNIGNPGNSAKAIRLLTEYQKRRPVSDGPR
jgi:hypothetical protein